MELLGRILQRRAGLGVGEIGRRHVRQRLGRFHVTRCERSRRGTVEIERTELAVQIAQREGEHRAQAGFERSRAEFLVHVGVTQVRYDDGFPGFVGMQAGSLAEFGLQPHETQRRIVRRGHVVGRRRRRYERHPGARDGEDLDDALHQVIQDPVDGKIGGHRACELAEHVCQLAIGCHAGHSLALFGLRVGVPSAASPKLYLVGGVGTTQSPAAAPVRSTSSVPGIPDPVRRDHSG